MRVCKDQLKIACKFSFAISGLLLFSLPLQLVAQNATFRDPTLPLGSQGVAVAEKPIELQAIFVRADNREAVVNGRRVREGQSVDGAHIVSIKEKSVVYRKAGKTYNAYLRASILEKK